MNVYYIFGLFSISNETKRTHNTLQCNTQYNNAQIEAPEQGYTHTHTHIYTLTINMCRCVGVYMNCHFSATFNDIFTTQLEQVEAFCGLNNIDPVYSEWDSPLIYKAVVKCIKSVKRYTDVVVMNY